MSARENEREAVRTTIVGGRPPGSGRSNVAIPRGIEVLVKKAAVDPEFRELLFEQRGGAAAAIELELDPAENVMLTAIPREQLAQIIGQTVVPLEHRRVFLGRIAAAMLGVLGVGITGCDAPVAEPAGIQPDRPERKPENPPTTKDVRPDPPSNAATNYPPPAGVRPDSPKTNSPFAKATPTRGQLEAFHSRGLQPDRP